MDKLRDIIDKYTEGNYLISKSDKEKMSEDILDLFDVSKPLAPKEIKSCMKADLKCGEVCKEHCGASWC